MLARGRRVRFGCDAGVAINRRIAPPRSRHMARIEGEGPYAFTTLPLYQGLIAIIHRAVLTAGPIVTILALKPSWLRSLTSVSVAAAMTTICLMCKQSFTRIKRYPNKFCGPVCSMRWRGAQLKMKRRAANTARGRKVQREEADSRSVSS